MRARAYRLSGGTRHPLRNGFTAYAALSPVIGLVCHRRPEKLASQELERQRRGVRTTRFCRTLQRRSSCTPEWRADALAPTTSRPAFVTTRDRPSCRNRTVAVSR